MPFGNRKRNGITFVFKSDPLDDTMAHIYARHRKTEAQAMAIWFGFTDERWNDEHQRFESYPDTEGLFWKWHEKDTDQTLVLVISCFDRREGESGGPHGDQRPPSPARCARAWPDGGPGRGPDERA